MYAALFAARPTSKLSSFALAIGALLASLLYMFDLRAIRAATLAIHSSANTGLVWPEYKYVLWSRFMAAMEPL